VSTQQPTRRLLPQERDPWYGYDHWRFGRVRVTDRVHSLLASRPVAAPLAALVGGTCLLVAGVMVGAALPKESGASWAPASMVATGIVGVLLGLGGLVSSVLVHVATGGQAEEQETGSAPDGEDVP